jgi:hypothetical protein
MEQTQKRVYIKRGTTNDTNKNFSKNGDVYTCNNCPYETTYKHVIERHCKAKVCIKHVNKDKYIDVVGELKTNYIDALDFGKFCEDYIEKPIEKMNWWIDPVYRDTHNALFIDTFYDCYCRVPKKMKPFVKYGNKLFANDPGGGGTYEKGWREMSDFEFCSLLSYYVNRWFDMYIQYFLKTLGVDSEVRKSCHNFSLCTARACLSTQVYKPMGNLTKNITIGRIKECIVELKLMEEEPKMKESKEERVELSKAVDASQPPPELEEPKVEEVELSKAVDASQPPPELEEPKELEEPPKQPEAELSKAVDASQPQPAEAGLNRIEDLETGEVEKYPPYEDGITFNVKAQTSSVVKSIEPMRYHYPPPSVYYEQATSPEEFKASGMQYSNKVLRETSRKHTPLEVLNNHMKPEVDFITFKNSFDYDDDVYKSILEMNEYSFVNAFEKKYESLGEYKPILRHEETIYVYNGMTWREMDKTEFRQELKVLYERLAYIYRQELSEDYRDFETKYRKLSKMQQMKYADTLKTFGDAKLLLSSLMSWFECRGEQEQGEHIMLVWEIIEEA